jgi:hypothetical protein
MKKSLWIAGCLLLWWSVSAYAMELSVTPQYWKPNLDANARIEKGGVGTPFDLVDDLGMKDEGIPGGTVDLKLGSNHISLSYWTVGYNGRKTLTRSFDYNGETYTVGTTVNSSFNLDAWELKLASDLLDFGSFRIGPMLNANLYKIDTALDTNDPSIPFNNRASVDLLLPLVGVRFGARFFEDKLEFGGQFGGLWWQGSGFWDGSAKLSFYPIKNFAIEAGYRMIHIDVSKKGDRANLKLDGPTLSATLSF